MREKTNNLCFRPGPTQTGLYTNTEDDQRPKIFDLEKMNCTIRVEKTKTLISFAVTAKLICAFVFAYIQIVGFLMRRLNYFCYTLTICAAYLKVLISLD